MSNHIQMTIADVTSRRDELNQVIGFLEKLGGEQPSAPALTAASRPLAVIAKKTVKPAANNKAQPNGLGGRVFAVLQTLPAPFDQDSVLQSLKGEATLDQVRGALGYMKKKGTIKTVEEGKPGHPAKFQLAKSGSKTSAAAPTKPRSHAQGENAATLDSLKQKLAAACKQRDHARTNGRDQMVDIFQGDIDRIEKEIEALS